MVTPLVPLHFVGRKMDYGSVGDRVFAGELLHFAGGHPFVEAARALCREVFDTANPQQAHQQHEPEEFLRRSGIAQQAFNTGKYKGLFAEWLRAAGVDTAELYWDTLGLRVSPPTPSHAGGFRSHVGVHRDTWGAGIQSQINWWAPIYPLAAGRTMGFYLDYFDKPLGNTTAEWSFREFLASRKRTDKARAAEYPSAPRATERPRAALSPLRVDCGGMVAFSSAHLHSSIRNRTSLTRFSFEIRTVSKDDINRGRGAPNADCESKEPLYRLYRAVADDQPLSPPSRLQ